MMNETETEKLARWWNILNIWEWPEDLEGKPDGYDKFPWVIRDGRTYHPNKYHWSGGIMEGIQKKIGHKECLRWHHLHNLDKTNDEFENWYENERKEY